jgi:5-methylcytosine-specific restriction endonuclease McrA
MDADTIIAARQREYSRLYRLQHVEQVAAYKVAYRDTHKTERAAYAKAYRVAHSQEHRDYGKRYRDSHVEEKLAYRAQHVEVIKAQVQAYASAHRAERNAYHSRYRASSEGKAIVCASKHRRRALQVGAIGASYTTATMIKARCALWGNRCYICGAPMQAIDHVKPLAKGGIHLPCNLRPICRSCNSKKHDKWPYTIPGRTP